MMYCRPFFVFSKKNAGIERLFSNNNTNRLMMDYRIRKRNKVA